MLNEKESTKQYLKRITKKYTKQDEEDERYINWLLLERMSEINDYDFKKLVNRGK